MVPVGTTVALFFFVTRFALRLTVPCAGSGGGASAAFGGGFCSGCVSDGVTGWGSGCDCVGAGASWGWGWGCGVGGCDEGGSSFEVVGSEIWMGRPSAFCIDLIRDSISARHSSIAAAWPRRIESFSFRSAFSASHSSRFFWWRRTRSTIELIAVKTAGESGWEYIQLTKFSKQGVYAVTPGLIHCFSGDYGYVIDCAV